MRATRSRHGRSCPVSWPQQRSDQRCLAGLILPCMHAWSQASRLTLRKPRRLKRQRPGYVPTPLQVPRPMTPPQSSGARRMQSHRHRSPLASRAELWRYRSLHSWSCCAGHGCTALARHAAMMRLPQWLRRPRVSRRLWRGASRFLHCSPSSPCGCGSAPNSPQRSAQRLRAPLAPRFQRQPHGAPHGGVMALAAHSYRTRARGAFQLLQRHSPPHSWQRIGVMAHLGPASLTHSVHTIPRLRLAQSACAPRAQSRQSRAAG